MSGRRDDRRNRQAKQKRLQEAQAEADDAKHHLEHTKYLADKAEHQAESYLERMRSGYSEGAKLYYDSFKTQATITTGCILVILALAGGVIPTNPGYVPLLW